MKNKNKKLFKLTLYRKEQLLIIAIIFCFALSSLFLPKIAGNTNIEETPSDIVLTDLPEADLSKTEISEKPKEETKDSSQDTADETDKSDMQTDSTTNTNESSAKKEEAKKEQTKEEPLKKEPSKEKEPKKEQTKEEPSKKKPSKKEDTSDKSELPPKQEDSSSSSEEKPQKEWIPPVYKTIHHDAVYETHRIVICNYCSESFSTVGEFQIHKDAHGG